MFVRIGWIISGEMIIMSKEKVDWTQKGAPESLLAMKEGPQKSSSISTILALVNTMIGGAMLTFPVLFKTAGLVSSTIVLFLSGLISHRTCRVYVYHMNEADADVESAINRIAGLRWERIFRAISGFYLLLLNIIYIDLIVDQTYAIVYFIFHALGRSEEIAGKTETTLILDKFSQQYMALIYLLPLLGITLMRNMTLLIRLAEYGVYPAFVYFLFIIYEFINSLVAGSVDLSQTVWFSWDIGSLAGGCALAFTVHTIANSILKGNAVQANNQRDLTASYILGFLLYLSIAVLGSLSIQTKRCAHTIVDCFADSWEVLFVEVSYLIGRVAVFPCVLAISRTRLLELIFPSVKPSHHTVFNVLFVVSSVVFSFLSPYIPIELFMNFVGSIVCYFFIYAIPTKIHYECLYGSRHNPNHSLLTSEDDKGHMEGTAGQCAHSQEKGNKVGRFLAYGVINVVGVAVGIYGLYTCFAGLLT